MLYVLWGIDAPDSLPKRLSVRLSHLARLQHLQEEGRLFTAGPMPAIDGTEPGENGFYGSLIIAEFPSLDAAREWMLHDPYVIHGVFKDVTVKPFRQVLP